MTDNMRTESIESLVKKHYLIVQKLYFICSPEECLREEEFGKGKSAVKFVHYTESRTIVVDMKPLSRNVGPNVGSSPSPVYPFMPQ